MFWIYLAILFGIVFLLYNVLFYLITKVPIVIAPRKYTKNLMNNLGFIKIDSNTTVYELGSGWGNFSFAIERFKPRKIIGYELSLLHFFYSKIKAKLKSSKAIFLREDFFKANFSEVDLFYVFLVPPVVERLWQKIKKECKPGTIMILLGHELNAERYFKKIKTNPNKKKSTWFYFYKV